MQFWFTLMVIGWGAMIIWLIVRFVNRRERWARRILSAAIGLPIVYVVSLGPACWVTSRLGGYRAVAWVYSPLLSTFHGQDPKTQSPYFHMLGSMRGGQFFVYPESGLCWYASLWAAPKWRWRYVVDVHRESFETSPGHIQVHVEYTIEGIWEWYDTSRSRN
jgi:hypothetical protein